MLVVFGDLLKRAHAIRIARGGEFGQQGERGIVAARAALDRGDIPHRAEAQIVRQPHLQCAPEETQRFVLALGLQQPAGQADQVCAVPHIHLVGRAESERHDGREAGQRENVDGIVVEDGDHLESLLAPQKIEVDVGDHFAGQIALALHAENTIFQIDQAAAFQP